MPRRTNSFQELIALIERKLAPTGAQVTESAMVPETLSGKLREIDILIKCTVGIREVLVGIECRDHNRKADIQWIEQARGKFDVLPIDKRVVVSRRGFTEHAMRRAREWNIEAVSLDQAKSVDWAAALRNPRELSIIRIRFKIIGIRLACSQPTGHAGLSPFKSSCFIHSGIQESADAFGRRLLTRNNVQKAVLDKLGQDHDWLKVAVKFPFPLGMCHTPDELGISWPVNWAEFDVLYKAVRQPLPLQFSMYNQAAVVTSEGIVDEAEFTLAMAQLKGSAPSGTARIKVYDEILECDITDFFMKSGESKNSTKSEGT